ncbi:hypothetical protein GCM10010160_70720 [Acrocarpospora corrugata]
MNSIPGTREDIPSFQWVGPDIDLSSDVTRDLTLPLAVVNVTLVDESGDPVPDVSIGVGEVTGLVGLYPGSGGTMRMRPNGVITGADGITRYRTFLGSPSTGVTLYGPGGSPVINTTIPAITTDPTDVTLIFPHTVVLSGVVNSSSGDPVPGIQVNLDGAIGETGADGSFTVSVPPGVHQITVNSIPGASEDIPSFQWVGPDIDLSSDVTRDLTLPLAVVNVTLVDESGDPVPDVSIGVGEVTGLVGLYPGSGGTMRMRPNGGITGADGITRYRTFLGSPSTGVTLYGPGGSPVINATIPAITADPTDITLIFPDTAVFSGVVRSSSGDPVSGVQVNLDGAIGETGADGSFRVSVLPNVHQLTVNSVGAGDELPSFQWGAPEVDLSDGDVTRDLTLPLAVVNVTVIDESGDPVSDVGLGVGEVASPVELFPGSGGTMRVRPNGGTTGTDGTTSYHTFLGSGAAGATLYGPGGSPVIDRTIPAVTASPTNVTLVLGLLTTTLSVVSSANPSTVGQAGSITATVAPAVAGLGTPTGSVVFTVDSVAREPAVLSSGSARLDLATLSAGTHAIVATYSGDSVHAAGTAPPLTQVVESPSTIATATTLTTSLNPSTSGQDVTFTAAVQRAVPGAGVPSGMVTFTIDGVDQTPVVLGSGRAKLKISSLAVGDHTIMAAYAGGAGYAGSASAALVQTVTRSLTTTTLAASVNPSASGQDVTFMARVEPVAPGEGNPEGTITFTIDGVNQTPVVLGSGKAKLKISTLAVGDHTITAAYAGGTGYAGSAAAPVIQTVTRSLTTTTLAASVNPSASGQNVTFTARVEPVAPGDGTPMGTITFTVDGVDRAPVALASGKATLRISTLAVGNHVVTATYAGTANHAGSTSSPLTQTVG